MYTHNLNPILLSMGPLQIRYYGLVYAFGFLLVYYFLNKKRKELNITRDHIETYLLYLIISLIVGARIFHFLFSDPLIFIRDPLELFKVWHGGMSFFGALVGVTLISIYYLKKLKLNFYAFADIIVIPATIALMLGRLANFINGELVGTVSNLPWCVVFPTIDNLCRHPYQIYASLSHLILLIVLVYITKLKYQHKLKNGLVFLIFLAGYSLLRFLTDFVREDPAFLGLTVWQYVSIVFFTIGIILWKQRYKTTNTFK